jgi:hypothetical protein
MLPSHRFAEEFLRGAIGSSPHALSSTLAIFENHRCDLRVFAAEREGVGLRGGLASRAGGAAAGTGSATKTGGPLP